MLHFAAEFSHEVFQQDPSDLHRLGLKKKKLQAHMKNLGDLRYIGSIQLKKSSLVSPGLKNQVDPWCL